MQIKGRYLQRDENENIVAISDSISYKMIDKSIRDKFTFAFKTINAKEAEKIINLNYKHCIGAVGHSTFAKNLNRLLNIKYRIPYGYGRERVHLTLVEGDYVVIMTRITNRASTRDKYSKYRWLTHPDDVLYTLAKVIPTPETNFDLVSLNEEKALAEV